MNRNDTKSIWPQEQKNIRRNDQTSLGPRGKRHYVYAYNIIHIFFLKTFRYFYHKICISLPNMIYIFAERRWTLKCDYELRKVPRQRTPPEGGIYATDGYIEQGSQTFGIPLSVYVKILYNIILYNILCRQSCFRAHGSMVITITFNLKTKSTNLTRTWSIPKTRLVRLVNCDKWQLFTKRIYNWLLLYVSRCMIIFRWVPLIDFYFYFLMALQSIEEKNLEKFIGLDFSWLVSEWR